MSEFDFEEFEKQFGDYKELLESVEAMTSFMAPFFLSYRKKGLTTEEAACLTVGMIGQMMTTAVQQQPPKED